jgi:hypothetical protein
MSKANVESGAGGGFKSATGAGISASTDTSERGQKVKQYTDSRNMQRVQPMIRSQLVALEGGTACYIYNVSPIFTWRRMYKGLGTFDIPKRPSVGDIVKEEVNGKVREITITEEDIRGKYKVSKPVIINHSYRMSFDKGDNRRVQYVEFGEEIAESVVGNSKLYPADLVNPTNNLENWGVFITYGAKFHDLPKEQQDELYLNALTVHEKRCREKVQKADQLINRFPDAVLELHRQCALFVGEDRPWLTSRGKRAKEMIECPWCGSDVKSTVIICPNCREVIDVERHAKMKKREA